MLTIRSVITYRLPAPIVKPKLSRAERVKNVRAARKAEGLCQNHGTELPCERCAAATKRWRDAKYIKKGKS